MKKKSSKPKKVQKIELFADKPYRFIVFAKKTENSPPIVITSGAEEGTVLWDGENSEILLNATDNEKAAKFFAQRIADQHTAGTWNIWLKDKVENVTTHVGITQKMVVKDMARTLHIKPIEEDTE